MNRGRGASSGYTIVETLIFLAVSAGLFVSAMALIVGKQNKTEFTNSVYELQRKLTDVAGNVSAGYYPNTNNFQCSALDNGDLTVAPYSGPTNNQGKNSECIFLGRVIQFAPQGTDNAAFNIYTVVGRRFEKNSAKSKEVSGITGSEAVLVARGVTTNADPTFPESIDSITFGGATIETVRSGPDNIGGIGFFSSLASNNLTPDTKAGSLRVELVAPVTALATTLNQTTTEFVEGFDKVSLAPGNVVINPAAGVSICMTGGSNQNATIKLGGGAAGALTSSVTFGTGACPP